MSDVVPKIYTTGYAGRDVRDLPPLLTALDAILIDVRFNPHSEQLVHTRDYLKLLLKNRYLHIPALGDRRPGAGKPQIQNLALGIKIVTSLGVNALLTCECADLERCHRLILLDEFRRAGFAANELESWQSV